MNAVGWVLAIGNILFGFLNLWLAFNGFHPNIVTAVANFVVGGLILKLLLED